MQSRLVHGSLTITVANAFSKILALCFIAIAGRLLGPQEYGSLALILSIGAIASTVPATAFPQALLWRIGKVTNHSSRGTLFITASIGTLVLAILCSFLVLLLPNIPWFFVAIVLADCVTYLFLNFQQGLLNYRQVALFSISRNMIKLLLLVIFWSEIVDYDLKYFNVVMIYLLAPLLAIIGLEILFPSEVSFKPNIDYSLLKELGSYGLPIAGSAIALAILMQGDVILLEYFHGKAPTGRYYAARQLFFPVMLFPVAFRGLLVPAISGNRLSNDEWRKLLPIAMSIAAFVAVITGFFGPLLIEVVYGSEFEVEQSLTLTICAAAWILSSRGILESTILGRGYSSKPLFANLLSVFVALIIYVWLIPVNGIDGAGQALLIASIFSFMSTTVVFVFLENEDRNGA